MSAERCRVCVHLNGATQYYQRDAEQKRNGKWTAVPFFVLNPREAVTMPEAQAIAFVSKLRSLGVAPWIEDAKDGRRIDVPSERRQLGEDNRTPVAATLDDVNWYVVKPICRPDGRKWFLRIDVPGIPEPQVIYADEPLGVLQRAQDMNFLNYAEIYLRPQPQQQTAPIQNGPRMRPGGDIS
jgi:hypothetical protein